VNANGSPHLRQNASPGVPGAPQAVQYDFDARGAGDGSAIGAPHRLQNGW
jgi:hypothetical protein